MVLSLVTAIFTSTVVSVVVMVVVIGVLIRQERLHGIIKSIAGTGPLVAFVVITLFVSLFNQNFSGVVATFAMSGVFIISLFIRSIMTRSLFEKIIELSCIASLPGFVVILAQRLLVSGGPDYRASSLFLNANYYATITELTVLLCVHQLIQPTHRSQSRTVLILAANLAGLYLSNCRTGVIALGFAVLALLVLNRRFKIAGSLLIVLFTVASLIVQNPQMLPRIDQSGSDLVNRVAIWRTAFNGFVTHPWFGQGARSYQLAAAKFGGPMTFHAHSLYLDPLLNFGLFGVLLLAMYYKENLKSIFRLHEEQQDQKRLFLMIAVLVSILIHGVTDITVFSIQVGMLVSVLMAVAGVHENQQAMRDSKPVGNLQPERSHRVPVTGIAAPVISRPVSAPLHRRQ